MLRISADFGTFPRRARKEYCFSHVIISQADLYDFWLVTGPPDLCVAFNKIIIKVQGRKAAG